MKFEFAMLYRYTSLARIFDPLTYPTHRLLAMLVPLAGVLLGAITLVGGGDFGAAVNAGFHGGASAFLAWILARELDPDNNLTAFIALMLATLGAFIATPNILALAGALVVCRIVNRIVGYPAKFADNIVAIGIALLTMLLTNAWLFGAMVALALLLDAHLPDPEESQLYFVIITLILTLATWGYVGVSLGNPPREWLLPVLIVSVTFLAHTITLPKFDSLCDATHAPLVPMRIKAGMVLLWLMALAFALVYGDAGVQMLMPLWAVFLACIAHRAWAMLSS